MTRLSSILDGYLAAIAEATGGPKPGLNPGLPAREVRRRLATWVAEPVEELVDLWAWRDGEEGSGLFWGGSFHPLDGRLGDLGSERENLLEHRAIHKAHGVEWTVHPDDVVPVVGDGGFIAFVDSGLSNTRGHVFAFGTHQLPGPIDMFGSLADAVQAAHYCVQAGYWVPEASGRFMDAPLRTMGVTEQDLISPPFATEWPSS